MITSIKNAQILISLLKQFNIRHIVLSPGNRNVPIVHSVEEDAFFHCYSITDERSAGFFAIGLIHQYKEPVAICCTSGTAVCNYASAVNEAFYQKIPLLVITADRNPAFLNQNEDQMISQMMVFGEACKYSVQLPIVNNDTDLWRCENLVNAALLELDHHGKGPVHIDVPMESGLTNFVDKPTVSVKKINRIQAGTEECSKLGQKLFNKRVLVLCGQNVEEVNRITPILESFAKKYNAVVATDLLSNLKCQGSLNTFLLTKTYNAEQLASISPDIVISFGGNFLTGFRSIFRNSKDSIDYWLISESGMVQDTFHCLSTVIEGNPYDFFMSVNNNLIKENRLGEYYYSVKSFVDKCVLSDDIPYSDTLVVREFMKRIPEHSCLHLANSSSVRLAQNFDLADNVWVTCNRGTNGIDGSMSSFIGEAVGDDSMHFLLIGDLSFFYDMNALWNRYIEKNIRILLNNNGGAEIFHYTIGTNTIKTLNEHTAAEHFYTAKGWAETVGFKYLSISAQNEIDTNLDSFFDCNSDKPILLEVLTKKDIDASVLHRLYDANKKASTKQTLINIKKKIGL